MGRVKLQIKRIENKTNRQVTFSKRRNGLIKKAYELSVLCDVDVALIMFSPSGRVSLFSGNKSIEEILARYVNLPEHERGSNPMTVDSHIEDIQQEIRKYRSQIQNMEKRLRIFESDPSEITTSYEIEYRAQILEETLKQVRLRKRQLLEEKYNHNSPSTPSTSHVRTSSSGNARLERDQPEILPPLSNPFDGENISIYEQIRPRGGLQEDNNMQRPEIGQVIDVNLSPWTEFYPTGNSHIPASQPRGRALLGPVFVSVYTINHLDAQ
ncbi:hypothetical protein Patl1_08867 [Pistacia atlantica]|uniref:Uncharacterized protein n=1 Tax=Pistacia atlantica TaxID=434234 RepID=A0ACC1AKK8_9ROSI|nr:hypothetical protein Patl1_08867 [Pistacia atlantica]